MRSLSLPTCAITLILVVGLTSRVALCAGKNCNEALAECLFIHPDCSQLFYQTRKACLDKASKKNCKAAACVKALATAKQDEGLKELLSCNCDKGNSKRDCKRIREKEVPCPLPS